MGPAPQSNSVVRFGMFEADVRSGELRKNGVRVKLQDLPFRALKLLLARPNQILSREEFRKALWPENVFVDFDHGISSAINRLRDALGDSADNPVFIETVDRRGYRWIAPTHVPAAVQSGPKLVHPEVLHPGIGPSGMEHPAIDHPAMDHPGIDRPGMDYPVKPSAERTAGARVAVMPHRGDEGRNVAFLRRGWVLLFPAAALLLALWGFKPVYRAAKASAVKSHPVSVSQPPAADHSGNEAEQFYLKGRFYWNKRTPDGLNKAVDAFTQAIIHDPNYAPAYVGLADCYNLLREYTMMPANEAYPRALAAAQRAVELDDQSSEAHASLAFALFWGSWDADGAEREFRRAIEINPNSAVAHHWYATYLGTTGRHDESLREIERAQSLDPASKSILADKGQLLAGAGRREEAVTLLKQLEAAEPDFISPHRYLKEIAFSTEDYKNFLAEWKIEASLLHDDSTLKAIAAAEKAYATAGASDMLRTMESRQTKLYEQGALSPYVLARTEALLGNKAEAMRMLTIAYQKHDENTIATATDPSFNSLHDEPAFKDLVARISHTASRS